MAAKSLTILIFGILSNIYAATIPSGQLIQSLLLTGTIHVLPSSKENRPFTLHCQPPFDFVGTRCVFVSLSKSTTFDGGRSFCKELNTQADLATFKDANEFHSILQYIKAINSAESVSHFWIGGRDKDKNNIWTWIDDSPMPMGSPFWGTSHGNKSEPYPHDEYCTLLWRPNRYYIHNHVCSNSPSTVFAPVCQYDPIFTV